MRYIHKHLVVEYTRSIQATLKRNKIWHKAKDVSDCGSTSCCQWAMMVPGKKNPPL